MRGPCGCLAVVTCVDEALEAAAVYRLGRESSQNMALLSFALASA